MRGMVTQATSPTRREAAEVLRLLTTDQAAEALGIGRRTLQERVEAREIACIKIGRAVRFDPADLRRFVEGRRIEARGWKGGASR
jgi:excisionase family DNA binding protein